MDKTVSSLSIFSKLEYFWRVLATAFGFSLFGIGGLLLTFFVFPLLTLFFRDKEKCHRISQKVIQKSFQLFIFILSFLGVLNYRFEGFDTLADDSGTILIANHPSLLDVVFLASRMPRCDCIVKETLTRNFFLKGVVKAAGYIPNSEAEILLSRCKDKLDESGMLLIFPEGTRTKIDKPITLQRGAANLALRTSSDIRLASIYCSYPMLTKEQKWYQIPPKRPDFVISIHQKLRINEHISDHLLSVDARRLTEYLQKQLTNNFEAIKQNGDVTKCAYNKKLNY